MLRPFRCQSLPQFSKCVHANGGDFAKFGLEDGIAIPLWTVQMACSQWNEFNTLVRSVILPS